MRENIKRILATFLLGVACTGMMTALDNQIAKKTFEIIGTFWFVVCLIVYIVGVMQPFKRFFENKVFAIWLYAFLLFSCIWAGLLEYTFFENSFLPMLLVGLGVGVIIWDNLIGTKSYVRTKG